MGKNSPKKIVEKVIMGAVIGGAIGSVIGATIKSKGKGNENTVKDLTKSVESKDNKPKIKKRSALVKILKLFLPKRKKDNMKKIPTEQT